MERLFRVSATPENEIVIVAPLIDDRPLGAHTTMSPLIMPSKAMLPESQDHGNRPEKPPLAPGGTTSPNPPKPSRSLLTDDQFQQLYTMLKWTARNKGVNDVDASELAQSAICQLVMLMNRLHGSLSFESDAKFYSWVHTVFHHILLKYFHARSSKRTVEPPGDLADPGPSPSSIYSAQTMTRLVHGLLSQLGPQDEQIVRWRIFENWKYQKIGDHLGVSDVFARQRFLKALERLRKLLADADPAAYL